MIRGRGPRKPLLTRMLLRALSVAAFGLALLGAGVTATAQPARVQAPGTDTSANKLVAAPQGPSVAPNSVSAQSLRVVTRLVPPFVTRQDARYAGFSVDLWNAIARQAHFQFAWNEVATVADILAAVKEGRGDLAIAAISITAQREQDFDFSHPMFESGLQIMVGAEVGGGLSLDQIAKLLTTGPMPFLLMLLAGLIVIPAHMAWFVERKHKERIFASSYVPGIFEAIWWATGAATGQQSDYPRSGWGRALSGLATLVSLVFLAYFTAALTSELTVETLRGGINSPQDLPHHRVGTIAGSTADKYLQSIDVSAIQFKQVPEMLAELEHNRLDAVVFDSPVLLYYAANAGKGKVKMVGPVLRKENYGILFPPGSPLRKPVNEALLRLREDGTYSMLFEKWFGIAGATEVKR